MGLSQENNLLPDLITHARKSGATAADGVWVKSRDLSISRRLGNPETIERSESSGLGLRVFVGAKSALISSNDTDWNTLKQAAERAVAMAKVAPDDPYAKLAPEELFATDIPDLDLADDTEPDADTLLDLCGKAEETAMAVKGITNSEGADAHFSTYEFLLATSSGFARGYKGTSSSLSVSVLAGEGTGMERDYDYAVVRHFADLPTPESIGRDAAARALKRLNPKKVATCKVPVVFDPRVGKSLLGYLASAVSGSAIARGTSFLKNDLGNPVFAKGVTVFDDPHIKRGLGSQPFDAEGVGGKKLALIEDGVLTTWLLDIRSALKLNMTPTGHASRGMASPPYPSSTNLYLSPGKMSPKELMGDIQSGLYVTETFGMGVNLVTGDYSQGASGFWIENGEIAYPVSEITIAGHLRDMYATLIPANNLEFKYSTNIPTVRVEGMTIAGA